MKVQNINIDILKPFEKNPKSHPAEQIDRIVRSIQEFGFTNPILALKENNMIIAGHARLKAAQQMNLAQVPVIFLDMPYEKAIAYVVADNRLAELAKWDEQMLLPLLDEIKLAGIDVELTGFTLQDISLMGKKDVEEDDFDARAAADAIKEPITQVGDIWLMGAHKLLCGDSTKREDVERLMEGKKADMVFTDPPYGISIVNSGNTDISAKIGFSKKGQYGSLANAKTYRKIEGDDKPFDPTFLLNLAPHIILWGANNYASKLPDNSHWIVWDKKAEIGADHNNFSDVELAWTNIGKKSCAIYRYLWSGLLREGNRKTELKERVHPTQKPVGLFGNILGDYTSAGNLIIDLFGGSGSTLIACEQLDRICYMMEIDPIYCDVIVQRFEKFTGQKAHKQEVSP